MRKTIAMALAGSGFIAGFVTAGYYAYFMWSQDWGPMGTRGHNLMFVLMLFGAIAIYFFTLILFAFVAYYVDRDYGK